MAKLPIRTESIKGLSEDIKKLGIDVVINRLRFLGSKSKYKITKIRDNNS